MDTRCRRGGDDRSGFYFTHRHTVDSRLRDIDPRPLSPGAGPTMKILAADHVVPIAGPPIAAGAVAVDGDAIVAVGSQVDLVSAHPDAEVVNYGEAAILPGFINCHSHLELTSMRGALDDVEHDFSAWLLRLNS